MIKVHILKVLFLLNYTPSEDRFAASLNTAQHAYDPPEEDFVKI